MFGVTRFPQVREGSSLAPSIDEDWQSETSSLESPSEIRWIDPVSARAVIEILRGVQSTSEQDHFLERSLTNSSELFVTSSEL